MAAQGVASPEVGDVYTRAHTLCQQVGETPQRFRALWGLFTFHMSPGAVAHRQTRWASSSSTWRNASPTRSWCRRAICCWGPMALYRGDPVAARAHLEQSLELSADPAALHRALRRGAACLGSKASPR